MRELKIVLHEHGACSNNTRVESKTHLYFQVYVLKLST